MVTILSSQVSNHSTHEATKILGQWEMLACMWLGNYGERVLCPNREVMRLWSPYTLLLKAVLI